MVSAVDFQRYVETWHEVARLPIWFQASVHLRIPRPKSY
ncbi:MAG: lipocalin family protein [bacterium]|nr:lipocalin family protein [bacterium]